MNYYNEHDPFAAAWLRRLIEADLIPAGDVDERSIEDVTPNDVAIYTSCHWFAGIGGWPYALRLAGWPDDRPVWTGSAPCQPFSAAGKGGGFADEWHLWPAWFWLIRQCRPSVIFGEQVSSAAGLDWFATVSADLEAAGYAIGAADLCAAGVGAPHIRQRLYFVADAVGKRYDRQPVRIQPGQSRENNLEITRRGAFDILADADQQQRNRGGQSGARGRRESANGGGMGDASRAGRERRARRQLQRVEFAANGILDNPGGLGRNARWGEWDNGEHDGQQLDANGGNVGFWSDLEWLSCLDGKSRPTQPGLCPLAHGIPARVGRLRGYGNAIVPPLAAEFIKAYQEVMLGTCDNAWLAKE